jgi:hypothetical protein
VRDRLTIVEHHSPRWNCALALDKLRLVPSCELPAFFAGLGPMLSRLIKAGKFRRDPFRIAVVGARARGDRAEAAHRVRLRAKRGVGLVGAADRKVSVCRRLESAGCSTFELNALRQADGAVACSPADAAWMTNQAGIARRASPFVPNGFDARRIQPPDAASRARLRRKFYFQDHTGVARSSSAQRSSPTARRPS